MGGDEVAEIVALPGRSDAWRVGDTEFVQSFALDSTAERFCIRKNASLMRLYAAVCPEIRGGRIVELGIADGGGTALLGLAAQPSKLVAFELAVEPRPALDAFIRQRQLSEVVRPFYGVDQSDRHELARIIDSEFKGVPIDLVVDDASHLYEPTLASFEVLFPRLRPGGLFVIEDWTADFSYAAAIETALARNDDASRDLARRLGEIKHHQDSGEPERQPLPRLALQLLLIAVASPGIVSSITLDRQWFTVRRGPDDLDPMSFAVADAYTDPFHWLEGRGTSG